MATIRETANSTYGEGNYTLKLENDGAVLSFCPSVQGTALGVVLAQAGNEEYIAEWNTLVSSIVSSTKAMQDFLNNNGHKSTIVITNVMNDANQDNYLLSVTLGTVVFDAVNGINLLGE